MLKPLRDYVVLEKAKEEEKTKSGIILTEQPKEEPGKGIVVAVGPGKMENGHLFHSNYRLVKRLYIKNIPELKSKRIKKNIY